ncbi:inversin-like isoform X2 [Penaeus monodon]|uniref:inversin-like isoform X2 n=1 Tax=Penaeus monodon TaxID=6687 RepID=UPI0018A71A93|nr:inversin-like isoform X2 [Penaeus monodon]
MESQTKDEVSKVIEYLHLSPQLQRGSLGPQHGKGGEEGKDSLSWTDAGPHNASILRTQQYQSYPNLSVNVPMLNVPVMCQSNAPLSKVFNFNPSFLNYYYNANTSTPAVSPGYQANIPVSPNYLAPGLPQLPSSPGFLTAAGYYAGFSLLGGPRLPGSPLPPLGQAFMPLHAAALRGDKQKLAELLQEKNINLEIRDRWGRVPLVYAVLGNNQEGVDQLLRAGARPDAVDSHKCTPLHFAGYKGYLGCIKAIVHAVESRGLPLIDNQGGLWLAQDLRGVTPLHHAAHHNNSKCLHALLKYAAPGTLDTVDHKKRTPLHWAAAYGSEENVRLLIKHGANNLMPDQEGKTPLHWAAISKAESATACVRTLIGAAPSSVNWQDYDGITALHLAVAEARKDIVDVILSVPKCNVDLTDNHFRTALHWACNRGLTAIVSRLLERGAHLGAVDVYGATPLHYAAQLDHADTVELLVRRPCVRDNPSKEGHTAMLWAAARGANAALTVMARHGSSLTQADPGGCTALHIAAGSGHVSTVGVLLRLRAPIDICANDGCTPLLHAAQGGHAHIVKLLAEAGASLDHRDSEGQCALHHAVLGGHLYLAQILIKAGTSVNVRDFSGRTPLHMAAYRGLSDIMFLLLENRGDVNARDHQGQSPLHWAAQEGHLGAVNTLLDFRAYPNYTQTTDDRYTPLDCAYVAEQLEIAEVLMVNGGLSVTRIMEIAATKIQAGFRGYLVRRYVEQHRLHLNIENSKKNGNILVDEFEENLIDADSGFIEEAAMKTEQQQRLTLREQATNDSSAPTEELQEDSKEGDGQNGLLDKALRATSSGTANTQQKLKVSFYESNPYNSVSGQRKSKGLASSIMRGARKKTVRNLELPDPGELGLDNQLIESDQNFAEDEASESEDDYAFMTRAIKGPSLVLAQALHMPGIIASAVLTVGNNQNQETRNQASDNNNQKVIENKNSENMQEKNNDLQTSSNNLSKRNVGDVDCQVYSSKQTRLKSGKDFKRKGVFKERPSENLQDFDYDSEFSNMLRQQKIEKMRILTENSEAAVETVNVEAGYTNTSALRSKQNHILSADARKQAEQKWKEKLASLTIKVQRPQSAKPGTSFSYNMVTSASQSPASKNHSKASLPHKKNEHFSQR